MATVSSVETDITSLSTNDQGTVGVWYIENMTATQAQSLADFLYDHDGIILSITYPTSPTPTRIYPVHGPK